MLQTLQKRKDDMRNAQGILERKNLLCKPTAQMWDNTFGFIWLKTESSDGRA
jgi:hypothetical protein